MYDVTKGQVMVIGQQMPIAPQCPKIREVLSSHVRRSLHDQCGFRVVTSPEPLRRPRPYQRQSIVTAGLEPTVVYKAKETDYTVELRQRSPPPSAPPEPDIAAVRKYGPFDRHFLTLFHDYDCEAINDRPSFGRSTMVHLKRRPTVTWESSLKEMRGILRAGGKMVKSDRGYKTSLPADVNRNATTSPVTDPTTMYELAGFFCGTVIGVSATNPL